jgi:hypothetical protein
VAGVSYLAYVTNATPYETGYPSVLSQEARAVFGTGPAGHVLYALVQAASALILFTGANTSFNGFPFLASFVAEDRFLPRQLTTRGHRLVFSNGIIVLASLAVALLVATGGTVNALVPFYAIGVFSGFAMAGFGMTRHHVTHREPGWRHRMAINFSAGALSALVVGIFAVAKFTEGAWLVVVVFPLLVWVLMRLNREYRAEAAILDDIRGRAAGSPNYAHHNVYVFVNDVDLAVLEALRYGRGLRPSSLAAVHFVLDATQAERVRKRWDELGSKVPLKMVDCPDRRLSRAAGQFVVDALDTSPGGDSDGEVGVTVLLPRRSYAPLLGRLLHDRSADRIARVISRIPQAAATIVPYDVQSRIREAFRHLPEKRATRAVERLRDRVTETEPDTVTTHIAPPPEPDVTSIDTLTPGTAATVQGRVRQLTDTHPDGEPTLEATLFDATGSVTLLFTDPAPADAQGAPEAGQLIRVTGKPTRPSGSDQGMIMINPTYRIIERADGRDSADDAGHAEK